MTKEQTNCDKLHKTAKKIYELYEQSLLLIYGPEFNLERYLPDETGIETHNALYELFKACCEAAHANEPE